MAYTIVTQDKAIAVPTAPDSRNLLFMKPNQKIGRPIYTY